MSMPALRRVAPMLLALGLVTGPARAVICDIQNEPAATLLLPYFEVDLDNNGGASTLVTINNAAPAATLVHLVLWSDLAVPVLDFNMYLTGFDQQQISLNDVIVNGNLPQTASTGQDPNDTISPKGIYSQDINFASCQGILPPPQLPAVYTNHLAASLTGQPSVLLGGLCAGRRLGDNIARGYMTMDVVNDCSLRFPGDVGYFGAGGTGDALDNNVLFGDYEYFNAGAQTLEILPLVHVQASATDSRVTTSGSYTFYGSRDSWTAIDNREPLPTTFGAHYFSIAPSTTQLIVWRDSKVPQAAFTCPATRHAQPSWFPLGQESIVVFDAAEHAFVPATDINSPSMVGSSPFPAAVQLTMIGGPLLPVPFSFGWVYLDLNTSVIPAGAVPPTDSQAAQGWVTAIYNNPSGPARSVGMDVAHFDSACAANHTDPTSN
jgi:hypothetical protein